MAFQYDTSDIRRRLRDSIGASSTGDLRSMLMERMDEPEDELGLDKDTILEALRRKYADDPLSYYAAKQTLEARLGGADDEEAERLGSIARTYATQADVNAALGISNPEAEPREGVLNWLVDKLDRPVSGMVGFLSGLGGAEFNEESEAGRAGLSDAGPLERAMAGLRGTHIGFGDTEALDVDEGDPAWERVLKTGGAFIADTLADPLTYLTGGAGTLGRKAATEMTEAAVKNIGDDVLRGASDDVVTRLARSSGTDPQVQGRVLEQLRRLNPNIGLDELGQVDLGEAMRALRAVDPDSVGRMAREGLTNRAAEAYATGGARGLRRGMLKEFGEETGEEVFDQFARFAPELRGGLRFQMPFASRRGTDGLRRGVSGRHGIGGGGRVFDQVGLGGFLDAGNTARNFVRTSKVGAWLGKRSGRVGEGWVHAVREGIQATDDTAGQGYSVFRTLRDSELAADRDMTHIHEGLQQTASVVDRFLQNVEGATPGQVRRATSVFANYRGREVPEELLADLPEPALEAGRQAADVLTTDILDRLGRTLFDTMGVDAKRWLDEYVPRLWDEYEKAHRLKSRTAAGRAGRRARGGGKPQVLKERSGVFSDHEIDEAGRTVILRFQNPMEANTQAGRKFFEEDALQQMMQYADVVTRGLREHRVLKHLTDSGIMVNPDANVRQFISDPTKARGIAPAIQAVRAGMRRLSEAGDDTELRAALREAGTAPAVRRPKLRKRSDTEWAADDDAYTVRRERRAVPPPQPTISAAGLSEQYEKLLGGMTVRAPVGSERHMRALETAQRLERQLDRQLLEPALEKVAVEMGEDALETAAGVRATFAEVARLASNVDEPTLRRISPVLGLRTAAEPPVPEGHVRLWRGETPPSVDFQRATRGMDPKIKSALFPGDRKGQWFTTQREYALRRTDGDETRMSFVDIPVEDLPAYRVQTTQLDVDEYVLPTAKQPPVYRAYDADGKRLGEAGTLDEARALGETRAQAQRRVEEGARLAEAQEQTLRDFANDEAQLARALQADAIPADPAEADAYLDGLSTIIGRHRRISKQAARESVTGEAKDLKSNYETWLEQSGYTYLPGQIPTEKVRQSMAQRLIDQGAFGPEVIADHLAARWRLQTGEESMEDFVEGFWKPFMTTWRGLATSFRGPGYIARNVNGGLQNAWYRGVGPRQWKDTGKAMLAMAKARRAVADELGEAADPREAAARLPAAVDAEFQRVFGDKAKWYRDTVDAYLASPTAGQSLAREQAMTGSALGETDVLTHRRRDLLSTPELRAMAGQGQDWQELTPGAKVRRVLAENPWGRFWLRQAQTSEDFLRLATFMKGVEDYGLKDGGMAADLMVKATQFDYRDLSPFEQRVMRNILPFYNWSRRNVPLQTRALMTQPGKINRIIRAHESVQDIVQTDEAREREQEGTSLLPEWVQEVRGFDTGRRLPFAPEGATFSLGMESPLNDMNRLFKIPGEGDSAMDAIHWTQVMGMLNPFVKTGTEVMSGTNTFTRAPFQPVEETPAWAELIPGLSQARPDGSRVSDPQFLQMFRNTLPPVAMLDRLAPSNDRYQERAATSWISALGGIPTSTLNDRQLAAELYGRVDEQRERAEIEAANYGEYSEVVRKMLDAGLDPETINALLRAAGKPVAPATG